MPRKILLLSVSAGAGHVRAAEAIRAAGAAEVCFVITGEWVDRDGDEDIACADYLEALLRGDRPNPARFEQRVRDSDFGRRFAAGTNPSLPVADLDLCAQADRFTFAMLAARRGEHFVLTPEAVQAAAVSGTDVRIR